MNAAGIRPDSEELNVKRIRQSIAVVAVVAAAPQLAVGAAAASPAQPITLSYHVSNLPADTSVSVDYNGGVLDSAGGFARTDSGSFTTVELLDHTMILTAADDGLEQGEVDQDVAVASASIVGVAHVPAGASVSLTNDATGHTIALSDGAFSIPTGVSQLGGAPSAKQTVRCRGNRRSCQAQVSIARGASNRRVVIRLTDTDLKLASVTAYPSRSNSAYSITGGHFTRAGAEYVMTLNAAQANPPGAHLILRFTTTN